jgi:uncharacterized glyoxalase superfamily protein PhnB
MSQGAAIRVTTLVPLDPARAFVVFTEDIGIWFRRTPKSFPPEPAVVGIRIEPGVDGRLLGTYANSTDGLEIGRITVWEPGSRLVFVDDDDTEVEVRFDADGTSTRVTLEHRGLGAFDAKGLDAAYRFGPRSFLGWYEIHISPDLPHPRGITPYLLCKDPAAMLDWLSTAFGFEEFSRFTDNDGRVHNAEMRAEGTEIWLSAINPDIEAGERPLQWLGVWVENVDAMHQRVRAAGVEATPVEDKNYGIRTFGVTDPEGHHWGFMRRIDNERVPIAALR